MHSNRSRFARGPLRVGVFAALVSLVGLTPALLRGQTFSVTDSSSTFNPVVTSSGPVMTDPFNDQQTGQASSDFISFTAGTALYNGTSAYTAPTSTPGFLVKSGQISGDTTNTYIAVRFLFQDSNGKQSYTGSYDMVGLDLDQNGSVDMLFGVDSTGSTPKLLFLKPGTGANTSPSTTTVASYTTTASTTLNTTAGATTPLTFNYAANIDPVTGLATQYNATGKPSSVPSNMNLTFAISFANLQQAIRDMGTVNGVNFSTFVVTGSTAMNFLAYTSTNPNAFNQDIYGGNISQSSSATWTSLGAFSTTFDANGSLTPTPEFGTVAQTAVLLLAGIGTFGWRKGRAGKSSAAPAHAAPVRV